MHFLLKTHIFNRNALNCALYLKFNEIIIFLSKFIKFDDVKSDNKPTLERYRQFKVDNNPVFEPFVSIEHKDHKQLIKDNNIKPIARRNGKNITIDLISFVPVVELLKIIFTITMVNKLNFNVRFVLLFFLIIHIL